MEDGGPAYARKLAEMSHEPPGAGKIFKTDDDSTSIETSDDEDARISESPTRSEDSLARKRRLSEILPAKVGGATTNQPMGGRRSRRSRTRIPILSSNPPMAASRTQESASSNRDRIAWSASGADVGPPRSRQSGESETDSGLCSEDLDLGHEKPYTSEQLKVGIPLPGLDAWARHCSEVDDEELSNERNDPHQADEHHLSSQQCLENSVPKSSQDPIFPSAKLATDSSPEDWYRAAKQS